MPQLAGPGHSGLTPWAQTYNDSPVGKAITRTIAPASMIPGLIGQVNKNFAQGPVDGLANAGYEGTAVALHPNVAAQDSTNRWSSALNGQPGQLLNDYWNHPGQTLAEDTQTLTQAHPVLSGVLGTAAQTTPIGPAANILSNPIGAAYLGDTAGGLAHLGYTESRRWGPALATLAPGGAAATTAAGIDPLANIKTDYQHDPAGALTQDLTTLSTIGGGFTGGAEAGGAEAGAVEAGTAESGPIAQAGATGAGTEGGATTGGLAGRSGTGAPRTLAPTTEAPATEGAGVPAPTGRTLDRTSTPTAATAPSRPELTGSPAGRPTTRAGSRPAGPAGTRPGGRTLGPRRAGGSSELAPVGGGNRPLIGESSRRNSGEGPGADSRPAKGPAIPRSGVDTAGAAGRDTPDPATGGLTPRDRLSPQASHDPNDPPPAGPPPAAGHAAGHGPGDPAGGAPDTVSGPGNVERGKADAGQDVRSTVSPQKQARHVLGAREYRGGGYFNSAEDAQRVLDAFHSGTAEVLEITKTGHIKVRFTGVTGFNNNPAKGFMDQPTNTFLIKGSSSPSVVPTSP